MKGREDTVGPRPEVLAVTPPSPKPGSIPRARLVGAIEGAPDHPIVAVLAPAGYGKSTLLRQVAEADGRPVAWLTLDRHDDDPVVLVSHVGYALAPSATDPPAAVSPGGSVWTTLVPRLGALFAKASPCLLILDDVHELRSTEAVDIVAWLALHVPRDSRLVVAGRSGVGLPLARMRVEGRLLELGPTELSLTDDEAVAILGNAVGMDRADAVDLNRRCEGWAAGIQLALLAGSTDESGSFVARPTGSDHRLREYLRSEILARLPAADRRFLLRSSVLHRLTGPLCDAVLETRGSGQTLLRLEAANALVSALDPEHAWYRYHDLFRESLLAELELTEPLLIPRLRQRASRWHADQGMGDEAVSYAREAGDDPGAAALIGRFLQPLFNQGRQATVSEWLDWVESAGLVGVHPSLGLSGALSQALLGEADRSDRFVRLFERMEWDGPLPDGSAGIEAWKSLSRSLLGRGSAVEARSSAERACELIPPGSAWRCLALTALGLGHLMCGDVAPAKRAFAEAVDTRRTSAAQPNALSVALCLLARIHLDEGDVTAARANVAEADEVRSGLGLTEQGPQAFIDAVAVRLLIVSGDRAEAARRLVHAQRIRPQLTWAMPAIAVATRLELARAHLALADPAGARTLLLEIGDILHRRPGLGAFEAEARDLRERLAAIREGIAGASTLTAAELRLVPMLATHLSFQVIGARLFVSTNTVKTQAMSVYRKLDATSRTQAVEHAARTGLLDPAAVTAIVTQSRGRG